jgi:hypothetical protein
MGSHPFVVSLRANGNLSMMVRVVTPVEWKAD